MEVPTQSSPNVVVCTSALQTDHIYSIRTRRKHCRRSPAEASTFVHSQAKTGRKNSVHVGVDALVLNKLLGCAPGEANKPGEPKHGVDGLVEPRLGDGICNESGTCRYTRRRKGKANAKGEPQSKARSIRACFATRSRPGGVKGVRKGTRARKRCRIPPPTQRQKASSEDSSDTCVVSDREHLAQAAAKAKEDARVSSQALSQHTSGVSGPEHAADVCEPSLFEAIVAHLLVTRHLRARGEARRVR